MERVEEGYIIENLIYVQNSLCFNRIDFLAKVFIKVMQQNCAKTFHNCSIQSKTSESKTF